MLPALLLTAGFGTRLDPLTRLRAKPAVPVAGAALVERVLGWLEREGVRDVVLNLHHLPQTVTGIVGDGRQYGVRVRYSWEGRLLGSAGGPRHALDVIDAEEFLIVNGDTMTDLALAPLVAAHRAAGAAVTLAGVRRQAPDLYNGLAADDAGAVTGVIPKGDHRPGWHFVGVQVARAQVFRELPDGVPAETIGSLYRDLIARSPGCVRVWPATGRFFDVGTPADYLATSVALGGQAGGSLLIEHGAQVDARASLVRTIVWPEASVEAGASLTDCIVAGPVTVPSGVAATRRVIVPAAITTPDDTVERRGNAALFCL